MTEWVYGRHLADLDRAEGLRMTYMAVEACTASLVVTGVVHADPHEGNIMLADDGRLVFLDFGLMSRVRPEIMEAFAFGIQCVRARDTARVAALHSPVPPHPPLPVLTSPPFLLADPSLRFLSALPPSGV